MGRAAVAGLSLRLSLFCLFAFLVTPGAAHAADFEIPNGDVAALTAAILTANSNGQANVINLAPKGSYVLTEVAEGTDSNLSAGLPVIRSPLTINGNGATIRRSSAPATPDFLIIQVSAGSLVIDGVTLTGGSHGGLRHTNTPVVIRNSTITRNTGDGGVSNSCGNLTIVNSTISYNTSATGFGGGGILIFHVHCIATLNLSFSTVYDNANPGWGRGNSIGTNAHFPGSMVIKNSILASPSNPNEETCNIGGSLVSLGHNIGGDSSCTFNGPGDLTNTNPLLGPTINNGGGTPTNLPNSNSPAIGGVPLADCSDTLGNEFIADQRGVSRPQGTVCDIGAVEAAAAGYPGVTDNLRYLFTDPGGQVVEPSPLERPTRGYAVVQPDASTPTPQMMEILGFRRAGVLVSETVSNLSVSPLTTTGRVPIFHSPAETGVTFVNPNDFPAIITHFFSDAAGNNSPTGSLTIPANSQHSWTFSDPSHAGWSTFTYTPGVAIVTTAFRRFRNERGDDLYSFFQPSFVATSPFVPLFIDGSDGDDPSAVFRTRVVLVNSTDQTLTGSIQFMGSAGTPVAVKTHGTTSDSFAYSIPPRASYELVTSGESSAEVLGSVYIWPTVGTVNPVAFGIVSFESAGITQSEAVVRSSFWITPHRLYVETLGPPLTPGSIETVVCFGNTAGTLPVDFKLTTLSGVILETTRMSGRHGTDCLFMTELFPQFAAPVQGILDVTQPGGTGLRIAALRFRVNERGDLLLSGISPAVLPETYAPNFSPQVLPSIVTGDGWESSLALISRFPGTNSGVVKFVTESGEPMNAIETGPQKFKAQKITFAIIPDKTYGDTPFQIQASASSGLPVFVAAAGTCTIFGDTVTITGAGSCTITASQTGSGPYGPAPNVVRAFAIAKATPGVLLTSSLNPSVAGQTVTFTAMSSVGVTGSVQFQEGATVIGNAPLIGQTASITISSLVAGTHAITAIYGGDSNFNPSTSVALTQVVSASLSTGTATAWAWGNNAFGQLGNGNTTNQGVPVQVSGLAGLTSVAGGAFHNLALTSDGKVWSWGFNSFGQLGTGGFNSPGNPSQVSGLSGVTAVAAGYEHSLALTDDGRVWSWGDNQVGQLGTGNFVFQAIPVQVKGLSPVVSIASGSLHSLALTRDGNVWGWGYNFNGQLGTGSAAVTQNLPVRITGLSGVVSVSAGYAHSLALTNDGNVWTWGTNSAGVKQSTPTPVIGISGVISIVAGDSHSLALTSDGKVWAWGLNSSGQLGNGNTASHTTPVQVTGLAGVFAIGAGEGHSLAVTSDGRVWSWGWNGHGQLGIGNTTTQRTPVQIQSALSFGRVEAGRMHSIAATAAPSVKFDQGALKVSTTFSNVSTVGIVTVIPVDASSVGTIPGGFALAGLNLAYEINTTATFSGPITICFQLTSVNDATVFSTLRVLHNVNGTLIDQTILSGPNAPNFATRTICAITSSLSPFVIATATDFDPPKVTLAIASNPLPVDTTTTLISTVEDTATGNSGIALAEYSLNGGGEWTPFSGAYGSTTIDINSAIGPFAGADVLNVCVRGTDAAQNATTTCTLLAVYDPSAGFVTGAGWIDSLAGAFADAPGLTGRATFGFVSRYQKGATAPTGNTEFQFQAARFTFKSTEYDWLVVSGPKAQYKGSGTVNDAGDYAFLLTVTDGDVNGGRGNDQFRIKIWDKTTGGVIYDNMRGASDNPNDPGWSPQVIGGGSVVIHAK
jgi:alpha-tubulin suppressor-like RCC1 family protein